MTSGPDGLDRPYSSLSPPQEAIERFGEIKFAFLKVSPRVGEAGSVRIGRPRAGERLHTQH